MNFIDKAILFVNPRAGLNRLKARFASGFLADKIRKYEAAGHNRRTAGWATTGTSANTETYRAGHNLRERARDLVRNNPYSAKAIRVISTNTVGTGIRCTPIAENKRAAAKLKKAWAEWAENRQCDFDGMQNFYGIQRLVMRSIAESGEVLIRKRRDKNIGVPLCLQVLEPDFIDNSRDGYSTSNGGYIIQGVEFDSIGKRVAYWLFDRHPSDSMPITFNIQSRRVPAEDIIHVFLIERPGQVRGVPFGVSAFLRLKDFDDYEDAQLMRQKVAACFSVFITEIGDGISSNTDKDPQTGDVLEKIEPGIIEHLPPGKTVEFASPPAVDGYSEYSRKVLQAIAAGYGVTYESLTGELKDVNFSSGRMGWLEFARQVNEWQWLMLVPMFLDPVFDWFNEAAVLAGKSNGSMKAAWTPPRREMIDPVKEIKAMTELVRAGFQSWSETVREQGQDPEQVLAELAKDYDSFDKFKMMLTSDPRYDPTRKSPDQAAADKAVQDAVDNSKE